jgi:hypothetical protein
VAGSFGASGAVNRLLRPDSVRHMSVTTATRRLTAAHHETQRHNNKKARETGYSQLTGYLRRWWQVLGSNQRRLSRRFYSPNAPPESPPADQHGRASRCDSGLPPSAMRPWAPDYGDRAGTDGAERSRTEPVEAVIPTVTPRFSPLTCRFRGLLGMVVLMTWVWLGVADTEGNGDALVGRGGLSVQN